MSRYLIAGAVALLGLGSMAQAQAQTQQCQNDQVAGAVVGGLAGGVIGGAIANDRRGFRGGYYGRGYYGRGYRRGFRRGNRGVGIALGALAGGLIGSQVARTSPNCTNPYNGQTQVYDPYAGDPNIDHNARRLGDPYGGQRVGYQAVPQQGRILSGGPTSQAPRQQAAQTECRLTDRVTNLPDGSTAVEQIQVCRQLPDGAWFIEDGF